MFPGAIIFCFNADDNGRILILIGRGFLDELMVKNR
jgi:hypothetical protein